MSTNDTFGIHGVSPRDVVMARMTCFLADNGRLEMTLSEGFYRVTWRSHRTGRTFTGRHQSLILAILDCSKLVKPEDVDFSVQGQL